MPEEIERKFLVEGTAWRTSEGTAITQGYLNRDKNRTVRVRIEGARAMLTVKGLTVGASRPEFEYPIPLEDARVLMAMCDGPVVEKIRRTVVCYDGRWEIDEFLGANAGLVVAEIELDSEGQAFSRPSWLGREVTHDPRYFNSSLATNPFTSWPGNAPAARQRKA